MMNRREALRTILFAGGALFVGCRTVKEVDTVEPEATKRSSETADFEPTLAVTEVATEVVEQTSVPTVQGVETEEHKAYYDAERVRQMYVFEEGRRIEEVDINPVIMEAVRNLNVAVEGDITNLLVRAIPVDNADGERFPDTLGIHFSEEYYPPGRLVLVTETEVKWFIGMRQDTLVDKVTASALIALQAECFSLGFPAYLAFAFRDDELQEQLREEAGGSGVARARNSEHLTGMAVDLYADFSTWRYPEVGFVTVANRYGFVSSISYQGDPPHFFYLDGVWPGLTQALLDAGIDPNNRRNSVDARIAVFQVLMGQATPTINVGGRTEK